MKKSIYSNEEKARAALTATAGRVITDEDFRICVCGALNAGMERAEIAEFMKLSPKFGQEAITRINSFKPEGNGASICVGSLIEWAKQRGFVPCWRDDRADYSQMQAQINRFNLTDYPTYTAQSVSAAHVPAIASAMPRLKRFYALEVPQTYKTKSGVEQLKLWARAVRTDEELTQIAAAFSERKTPLLSLDELTSIESVSDLEAKIKAPFDAASGVWVMLNPVHDEDGKTESVSAFKYVLWESDHSTLEEQYGAIVGSRAPIDAVIHSGGKSLHAFVRVDAENAADYAEKVRAFFAVLDCHGADYDPACKNANRLCRLPGMMRGEQMQSLIALRDDLPNACADFSEWLDYEASLKPERKKILQWHTLATRGERKIKDPIIGDFIRPASFTLIAGDSKTGKTWLMQYLAVCAATGTPWLGHKIAADAEHPDGQPIKVAYVNTEVSSDVFYDRLEDVAKSLGLYDGMTREAIRTHIYMCHTRSVQEPITEWEDELIEDIKEFRADLVILDPLYMVIEGDENAVEDTRPFIKICERIGEETQAAYITTHHHRKGDMTALDIYNRIAGSGIFTRAPDNIIDLSYTHGEWIADCGGVNTYAKDGKESAAGVRFEYLCRDSATPAPSYWWRCHAKWLQDTTNYLAGVWHDKKGYDPKPETLDALRVMLGDCVSFFDESQEMKWKRQQSASNETRIIDRLAQVEEPQTIKEIAALADVPESTTSRIIGKLEERGKVTRTQKKDDKGRKKQAYYIS